MQTQANILGIKVDRPVMRETTALGAAIAAGFAVGIWKVFDELKEINKDDRTIFESKISKAKSDRMFKKWEQAVQMCRGWVLQEEHDEEDEPVVEAAAKSTWNLGEGDSFAGWFVLFTSYIPLPVYLRKQILAFIIFGLVSSY